MNNAQAGSKCITVILPRVMLHSHKILFKNINKTCLKVRN